ncbi:MAG: DUF493 family protein [Bacteroidales bacterium]|nr:DUF493 family protein [Bacteroidales bacterium]
MDYSNLKVKLNENHSWPSVYMFKFIVHDDAHKLDQVQKLFSKEAELSYKASRNGSFIAVTGKELMLSADEVIRVYQKAESIKNLIAL